MRQLPRLLRARPPPGSEAGAPSSVEEPRIAEVEAGGLRWYHVQDPHAADTAWLAGHFDFHPLDLEDVTNINQRPKLDVYDDYLFLVVQFPRFAKPTGRLHAAELDAFIGPDYVVTCRKRRSCRCRPCGNGSRSRPRCAARCSPAGPDGCSTRSWTGAWMPASRCSALSDASCAAWRTTS